MQQEDLGTVEKHLFGKIKKKRFYGFLKGNSSQSLEDRERSGLTKTRGCLFGFVRKKTAHAGAGEINGEETTG